jgi:3-phosphoshikimate 1-carboxyvinyltransferase
MNSKKFNVFLNSKIGPFNKTIQVDADKSLSIRSFLIGSISEKISTTKNILESEDVKSTINACKKLGVKIKRIKTGKYKIFGKGLGCFYAKKNTSLNVGNSGTLARLLIGILSTTPDINIKVIGDSSLNKRNMKELINLMSKFGASFLPKEKYFLPFKIISSGMPVGIDYKAGESAQLKSAVMFAGLNSYGITTIEEKIKSRDHTENLLIKNTQSIKIKKGSKKIIKIFGKKNLNPLDINVGGDPSSAAFFTALTLLNKDSFIKIKNVGLNPSRTGFYKILKKQKAKLRFINIKKRNNEITGDIVVKSCKLKPIKTKADMYPSTTDEYLLLFLIAAFQNGVSVFEGISGLANKESSRAFEMKKILNQIGIKCVLKKDQMKIYGQKMIDASRKKIKVSNLQDHRIAMCAFILAILTKAKTKIKNFETVYTSSPSFLKIMKNLGAKFEIQK